MTRKIKTFFISLSFLILFMIVTFPYYRMGPKGTKLIEDFFAQSMRIDLSCDVEGFNASFPIGFEWDRLSCYTVSDELFLQLKNAKLKSFITKQSLKGDIGRGQLELKASTSGITKVKVKRIQAKFDKVPIKQISTPLFIILNSQNPMVPEDIKLEGNLSGEIDFPTVGYHEGTGKIDLKLENFKAPKQSHLDMIGLQELAFTKSVLKANLLKGKLKFTDMELSSDHISAKLSGDLALKENFQKSSGSMTLKWKITESDAIQNSRFGGILLAMPCPGQDREGYCSRRTTRFSDLFSFSPY